MNCVVCYEEAPLGLACSSGHVTCDSCLAPYMGEKAAALAKTNLLAAQFDAAESTGDAAKAAALAGACHCPFFGHGCEAPAFDDKAVASHTTAEVFAKYLEAKTLLPAARRVQQVLQKRQELRLLVPNARQCGRCSYGPVVPEACSNLASHHGELRRGQAVPVDNSCPRCGWFVEDSSQWPTWEPSGLAADDPLDAAFNAAADDGGEGDEAAAARRAAREAELSRFREERLQRARERRQREAEARAAHEERMQQAMRREHERQRARHDAREAEIEAEIAALAAVDAKPAAAAAGLPSTQSEVAAAMAVARQGDGAPADSDESFLRRVINEQRERVAGPGGGGPHDRLFVDRAERRAALEAELAHIRAERARAAARAEEQRDLAAMRARAQRDRDAAMHREWEALAARRERLRAQIGDADAAAPPTPPHAAPPPPAAPPPARQGVNPLDPLHDPGRLDPELVDDWDWPGIWGPPRARDLPERLLPVQRPPPGPGAAMHAAFRERRQRMAEARAAGGEEPLDVARLFREAGPLPELRRRRPEDYRPPPRGRFLGMLGRDVEVDAMREMRRSMVDDAIARGPAVPPGHRLPFEADAAEGGGPLAAHPPALVRAMQARVGGGAAGRVFGDETYQAYGRPMLDALRAGVPVDAAAIRAEVARLRAAGNNAVANELERAGRLQLAGRFGPPAGLQPPVAPALSAAVAAEVGRGVVRPREGEAPPTPGGGAAEEGSPAARTLEPWPQRRRRGPVVTEDGAVIGWTVPPADPPTPGDGSGDPPPTEHDDPPTPGEGGEAPAEVATARANRVLEARIAAAADSLAVARRRTDRAADVALFTRLTGLGSGAAEMYLEGGRSVEGAVRAAIQGLHAPGAVNNSDVVEEGGRYTVRAPTIDRATSAGAPPAPEAAAAAQEAVDAAVLARVMEGSDSEEY